MIRAAFLDRDGVINVDVGYLHRIEDFAFIPGAVDAMRALTQADYQLVVITNQSGLARGLFDEAAYTALTAHMIHALARAGVATIGVYHCPHLADAAVFAYRRACDCRKPAPGLIRRAVAEHGIDPALSILVGDKLSDISAGRAAGVGRCFLVGGASDAAADASYPDLAHCVAAVATADLATRSGAGKLGLSQYVR